MTAGEPHNSDGRPRRSARLRKWLILASIVALAAGLILWIVERRRALIRRDFVESAEASGGAVAFHYQYGDQDDLNPAFPAQPRPEPGLVRRYLFGDFSTLAIHSVRFPNEEGVAPADLARLMQLDEARALYLAGTEFSDDELSNVASMSSLRVLVLDATNVTDAGLEALQGHGGLRGISFSSLPVTDEGLKHLEAFPHLEWVGAFETSVTRQGVEEFQRNRPSVRIHWSNPRDAAHREAIANLQRAGFYVHRNQAPKMPVSYEIESPFRLVLTDPIHAVTWRASDDDLQNLQHVPNIRKLDLSTLQSTGRLFTNRSLDHLAGLDSLTELGLESTGVTDEGMKQVAQLERLRSLNLSRSLVGGNGLLHIANIKTLRFLNLHSTGVDNEGVKHLAALPHLKELDLSSTQITEEAVPFLARIRPLRKLDVRSNGFSEEAYARLRRRLPDCEVK